MLLFLLNPTIKKVITVSNVKTTAMWAKTDFSFLVGKERISRIIPMPGPMNAVKLFLSAVKYPYTPKIIKISPLKIIILWFFIMFPFLKL